MTYNVENLFDTKDDPKTKDETFLPLTFKKSRPDIRKKCNQQSKRKYRWQCLSLDWSEKAKNEKMRRVAQVIQSTNKEKGPDILVLTEVENKAVVEELNAKFLKKSGYRHVLSFDDRDPRGIDIAILSRLELRSSAKLLKVEILKSSGKKRGSRRKKRLRSFLKASFFEEKSRKKIHVFGVHLPATFHPVYERTEALNVLQSYVDKIPENEVVFVAGDFNVIDSEYRKESFYKKFWGKTWSVSHVGNCEKCLGTYFYQPKKQWSFLDVILLRKKQSLFEKVEVVHSVKNQSYPFKKVPVAWKGTQSVGVSDHFPIYAEVVLK